MGRIATRAIGTARHAGDTIIDTPAAHPGTDSAPPAIAASTNSPPALAAPFEFTGDGREYFRIWVVNLVLTLATLGIYSAWAKVRKTRYFWQNTRLAGHVFDFHGRPGAILRGRIVALALLLAYTWSFQFSLTAGVVTITVLCAAAPWLLLKAQQFRLHNTSHRGLRFGFAAGVADAYRMGLPPLVLWLGFVLSSSAVTMDDASGYAGFLFIFPALLGVLLPLIHHRLKAFQHRHATYGDRAFGFEPARAAFYKTYLKGLGVAVLAAIALFGAGGVVGFVLSQLHVNPIVTGVLFGALGGAIYLFLWPYMSVRLQQVVWRHTFVDGVRFDTALRVWPLIRLVVVNFGLTALTLGLYWPFASVAFARYRITSMRMSMTSPLAWVEAGSHATPTALGDAATDGIGLDLGL
jgi:uncharacterized membrane protein YjgN (DUF898 family)